MHLRVVLVPPEACIDLARIEPLEKEAFVNLALRHLGDEKKKQRVCDEWGDKRGKCDKWGKVWQLGEDGVWQWGERTKTIRSLIQSSSARFNTLHACANAGGALSRYSRSTGRG